MSQVNIILDGDNCWPELRGKDNLIWMGNDSPPIQIAALPGGMESGKTSLAIRLDLPDGSTVCAEMSLALFQAANIAFTARFGHQME